MRWSWQALIFGGVFLLFPVAHLRLFSSVPIYAAEIPLLIVLALLASRWVNQRDLIKGWFTTRALWGAGSFVGGALLAFLLRELPFRSLGLMKSFVLLPVAFSLALVAARLDAREHRTILVAWWLGTAGSAIAGLLALALGYLTYDGRLAGPYLSPNHLAMLLAPGVIIGNYLLSHVRAGWLRFFVVIVTTASIGALLATRSYGVLAATIFGSGLFWVGVFGWRRATRVLAFPALLTMLILFFEIPTEKFQALLELDTRSSLASRIMIWESGLTIARDSFPWGIGIGQFQQVYLAYQPLFPSYLEWAVPEPHQLFLAWYLSTGLWGLAAILWCLVHAIGGLWSVTRRRSGNEQSLAWCYLGIIGYWLFAGLVDTPYFKNDLALGLWGVLGLAWSLSLTAKEAETRG